MSRKCPACGSMQTKINVPVECEWYEKYDGQLISDVDVPYHCNVCGYEWSEKFHGKNGEINK